MKPILIKPPISPTARRLLRMALLITLLSGLILVPAPARAEPPAQERMLVATLVPLVRVYEGDTINVPYMIIDSDATSRMMLAPLTPGEASVTASLGTASVTPNGLSGTVTYTAEKAGQESIVLTVTNYMGTGVGTIDLTVYPRPNYDLNFIIVTEDSDEAGGAFRSIFSGEGQFANVPDQPISGEGTADLWFSLWVTNPAFVCAMNPPVQGAASFTVTGVIGPVPLVDTPGFLESFFLDLNFPSEVTTNASNIECAGLGGIGASFPWPASSGSADAYPLKGLYFPGEGGVQPVTAPKTWGSVWVTRIDQ